MLVCVCVCVFLCMCDTERESVLVCVFMCVIFKCIVEHTERHILCLLCLCAVDREGKGGEPNLIIWDVESGAVRKSFTQKKQMNW